MSDIFISYSSKDKEKADQLSELLASAGLSVWIDQSGIDVATSWSKEIVQAIDACKAFVVLLSPNSIASENVVKEISLAAERKKKILPLDIEPVILTDDFAYHLAGIQRAPMTNIDAIIRALGKLGLEATQAPTLKLVKETDARKSLMILPFEDMSPTGDNGWFADGLASELISALSNVKALHIADAQATKEFKKYNGQLTTYAREMNIRYFVQGDVRKFGDNIKITARLLDIETGDHLWQDTHKGAMQDIFDIQETVAIKVVNGLKVHLTKEEKSKLEERGTESAEAYEYFLRADQLISYVRTLAAYQQSIALLSRAIDIDPEFAGAYAKKSISLTYLYQIYDSKEELLREAEENIAKVEALQPNASDLWLAKSNLCIARNDFAAFEHTCLEWLTLMPDDPTAIGQLGYLYFMTGRYAKALEQFEIALRLSRDGLTCWNAAINAYYAGNGEALKRWSIEGAHAYEKWRALYPNDQYSRAILASLYDWAGRSEESLEETQRLESLPDADANSLWFIARLRSRRGEHAEAMVDLRKIQSLGSSVIKGIAQHPDFISLRELPEFEILVKEVEAYQHV